MKTIMFFGDSITDCGRDYKDWDSLGFGFPLLVDSRLDLEKPEVYKVLNRGTSGDRVADLYARLERDVIAAKPDILSILVGVNDVWHPLEAKMDSSSEKFRTIYHMMLSELRDALPETKIFLMEPFAEKGWATEKFYDVFRARVEDRARIVRELAEEYNLTFIPLQQDLDELSRTAPAQWWLADGVHPKMAFYQYMTDKWIAELRAGE